MTKANREALIKETVLNLPAEANAEDIARQLHTRGHDVTLSEIRQVLRKTRAHEAAERAGLRGPVLQAKRELVDMGLLEEFYANGEKRTRVTTAGIRARNRATFH